MTPIQLFINRIAALINADTSWLASPDNMKMALVAAPFVPAPTLVAGDLTLATFDGSGPPNVPAGAQNLILDSVTGSWGVSLKEPTGGFIWICSTAPLVPETIYGYALLDSDLELIASALLDEPVVISAVGNYVQISSVFGFLSYQPIS